MPEIDMQLVQALKNGTGSRMRCDTCCFWSTRDGLSGGCHRRAPHDRDENTGQALWPLTSAPDSCGEHAFVVGAQDAA